MEYFAEQLDVVTTYIQWVFELFLVGVAWLGLITFCIYILFLCYMLLSKVKEIIQKIKNNNNIKGEEDVTK